MSSDFRSDLLSCKRFLKDLYLCKSKYKRSKILDQASSFELNTVLKIVGSIAKQNIPLNIHFKSQISRSKRMPMIALLESENELKKLLNASREEKIKYLKRLSIFPLLFHYLFEAEK